MMIDTNVTYTNVTYTNVTYTRKDGTPFDRPDLPTNASNEERKAYLVARASCDFSRPCPISIAIAATIVYRRVGSHVPR